jgi:hypothetical protein
MSCTECGRKGGCSSRKGEMFGAIDEILARLYPHRRWGHRDEVAAFEAGIASDEGEDLARTIAARLGVSTRFVAGGIDEWCDYIYVLCLGRAPSIVDLREDRLQAQADLHLRLAERADTRGEAQGMEDQGMEDQGVDDGEDDGGEDAMDDRYLRLTLSALARVVGVQEVAMRLRRHGDAIVVTEQVRGGVFDPILLPRFQALVALLAETDLRHLDFGEIVEPPVDFDGADYVRQFGSAPVVANYLFSPRPVATRVTTILEV